MAGTAPTPALSPAVAKVLSRIGGSAVKPYMIAACEGLDQRMRRIAAEALTDWR